MKRGLFDFSFVKKDKKQNVPDPSPFFGNTDDKAPSPVEGAPRGDGIGADTVDTPKPKEAPEEPTESESSSPAPQDGGNTESGQDDYDFDSTLSEFYDRLYRKLRSYGVTDIPEFSQLYGLFESLLRPAIDAAIAARQRTGRRNMAELDADAYARGMGGSSYLTSVKAREQDDVASDVTALEGQYVSSMGDYLYKALSKLQDMEAELQKTRMSIASAEKRTRMQIAAANRRALLSAGLTSQGSGADGGEGGEDGRIHSELGYMPYGHDKNGAYFDGQWYDGDFSYFESETSYGDYVRWLRKLSPSELYLFFNSNDKEWRSKRWQIQYNLPQVDYLDLVELFRPSYGGGHGSGSSLWQSLIYD